MFDKLLHQINIFIFYFFIRNIGHLTCYKANWNCSAIRKHKAFIHAVWSMSHIVEQETDSVYGPLPPKIDSDKYVDEYFMPAMPGVSELRGMANSTSPEEVEVLKAAGRRSMLDHSRGLLAKQTSLFFIYYPEFCVFCVRVSTKCRFTNSKNGFYQFFQMHSFPPEP